ncbi:unnamed protein product [Anisakis simplex]|uniref:Uncharacterized protein n=1 Tax=Anisakis simplex TaxID=6269 RepID=A0A3P6R9X3_ANISI|nr:unnamed protein product [Anisakis simplex]
MLGTPCYTFSVQYLHLFRDDIIKNNLCAILQHTAVVLRIIITYTCLITKHSAKEMEQHCRDNNNDYEHMSVNTRASTCMECILCDDIDNFAYPHHSAGIMCIGHICSLSNDHESLCYLCLSTFLSIAYIIIDIAYFYIQSARRVLTASTGISLFYTFFIALSFYIYRKRHIAVALMKFGWKISDPAVNFGVLDWISVLSTCVLQKWVCMYERYQSCLIILVLQLVVESLTTLSFLSAQTSYIQLVLSLTRSPTDIDKLKRLLPIDHLVVVLIDHGLQIFQWLIALCSLGFSLIIADEMITEPQSSTRNSHDDAIEISHPEAHSIPRLENVLFENDCVQIWGLEHDNAS